MPNVVDREELRHGWREREFSAHDRFDSQADANSQDHMEAIVSCNRGLIELALRIGAEVLPADDHFSPADHLTFDSVSGGAAGFDTATARPDTVTGARRWLAILRPVLSFGRGAAAAAAKGRVYRLESGIRGRETSRVVFTLASSVFLGFLIGGAVLAAGPVGFAVAPAESANATTARGHAEAPASGRGDPWVHARNRHSPPARDPQIAFGNLRPVVAAAAKTDPIVTVTNNVGAPGALASLVPPVVDDLRAPADVAARGAMRPPVHAAQRRLPRRPSDFAPPRPITREAVAQSSEADVAPAKPPIEAVGVAPAQTPDIAARNNR